MINRLIVSIFCCLIVLSSVFNTAKAQSYVNALGLQGGNNDIGITLQQRIFEKSSLEALLSFSTNHGDLALMYQFHEPLLTKGLNFYVGAGPHLGLAGSKFKTVYGGLTGIVGLEMRIPVMPLIFAASLRPQFHLNRPEKNYHINTAISVRYIITRNRDLRKKRRKKKREKKGSKYKSGNINYKK